MAKVKSGNSFGPAMIALAVSVVGLLALSITGRGINLRSRAKR